LRTFQDIHRILRHSLSQAPVVDVGEWQSLRGRGTPQEKTIELLNSGLSYDIPESVKELQLDVDPNLPWAEDHFQERVSGEPLNPGEQYKNWPWYRGNVPEHMNGPEREDQFSHTYMERYWPKHAGNGMPDSDMVDGRGHGGENYGIRYSYGDLQDLVSLLSRSPYTRQAYLPVWFPEDTGAVSGERVPCSLGYHFIVRDGRLHVVYYIRSCDFFRHFRDDVYLTCRLAQWVIQQQRQKDARDAVPNLAWNEVKPGTLTMHITSLHCFEAERSRLT
jgi:hypothetical protein